MNNLNKYHYIIQDDRYVPNFDRICRLIHSKHNVFGKSQIHINIIPAKSVYRYLVLMANGYV